MELKNLQIHILAGNPRMTAQVWKALPKDQY